MATTPESRGGTTVGTIRVLNRMEADNLTQASA